MTAVVRAEFLENQQKFEAVDPVLTESICQGLAIVSSDRVTELEGQLQEMEKAKSESDQICQKYALQIHDLDKANKTLEGEKKELVTACDVERELTRAEQARVKALEVELDKLKKDKADLEKQTVDFTVGAVRQHLTSARYKIRCKYPDHAFDFSDLDFKKIELPEGFTASDCSYNEEIDTGEEEGEEVNTTDVADKTVVPSSSAPKE